MEEPNQTLKREHEAVEELLSAMDQMAVEIGIKGKLSAQDMDDSLSIIEGFVDKCHHAKEEKILFPALSKASPETGAEMARRLTSDHRAFRQLAGGMRTALSRAGADAQARSLLRKNIGTYTNLVRAHIGVEEDKLFREVERSIDPDERGRISVEFERLEEEVVGHGMHEKYHMMIESLEKKYGT